MALGNKTLDDLLAPISKQLGHTQVASDVQLPEWEHVPVRATDGLSQAELVDMFADEAEKVRVGVHRCTKADLAACVAGVIGADEPGTVVCATDPEFQEAGLAEALEGCADATKVMFWDPDAGRANVEFARFARYGVTHAVAGIAETGTIVQPADANCGRAVSLLPLTHIAVIEASKIKPLMIDVMKDYDASGAHGKKLPSQLCFISGPSATADIELVRVEGVHGPMYVHYVIVDDLA